MWKTFIVFLKFLCSLLAFVKFSTSQGYDISVASQVSEGVETLFTATGTQATFEWVFFDETSPPLSSTNLFRKTFPDDGVYRVTLNIDDGVSTASIGKDVTVANVAPTVLDIRSTMNINEGDMVTFTADATDVAADWDEVTFTWDIQGGDDRHGNGATYLFLDDGTYTVTLTLGDGVDTVLDSFDVVVANVPPVITSLFPDISVTEGDSWKFTGTATDVGPEDVPTFAWDIDRLNGDVFSAESFSGSILDYKFTDDGDYIITLTVSDDDSSSEHQFTVHVANAAPEVVAVTASNVNFEVTEAGLITFYADATDDGVEDVLTYDWLFYDDEFTVSRTGVSATYIWNVQDGNYDVSLRVTDDGGSESASYVFSVTVNNVLPVFNPGVDVPALLTEGTLYTFTAHVTDVASGDLTNMYYEWDFGDDTGVVTMSGITYMSATHSYVNDDSYTVTLRVQDNIDDLDRDTHGWIVTSFVVTVNNAAPIPAFETLPGFLSEGEVVSFSGSATDLGVEDVLLFEWEFGDGATFSGSSMPTYEYPDAGDYLVTLTVSDEDGGSMAVSTMVVIEDVAPTADFDFYTYEWYFYGEDAWKYNDYQKEKIVNPTHIWVGQPIYVEDKSYDEAGDIVDWTWTWGDGSSSNTYGVDGSIPVYTHIYTVGSGEPIEVQLDVIDLEGLVIGVYTSSSFTVFEEIPESFFVWRNSHKDTMVPEEGYFDVDFEESAFSFQENGIISVTWAFPTFPGMTMGVVTSTFNPTFRFPSDEIYTVTLTVENYANNVDTVAFDVGCDWDCNKGICDFPFGNWPSLSGQCNCEKDWWPPTSDSTACTQNLHAVDQETGYGGGSNSFGVSIMAGGGGPGLPDARRDSDEEEMIQAISFCASEHNKIFIDLNFNLYIYGDAYGVSYLDEDTDVPQLVPTGDWNAVPFKVVCTQGSLFVLAKSSVEEDEKAGVLYSMGANEDGELSHGVLEVDTFTLDENFDDVSIHDIVASRHVLYVQVEVPNDASGWAVIYSIGENNHGCMAFGFDSEIENEYLEVVTDSLPYYNILSPGDGPYDCPENVAFATDPVLMGAQTIIYPEMMAIEDGIIIKYTKSTVFYAGKEHPSLGTDSSVLALIDFDNSNEFCQMESADKIDFISRMHDGYLFMVSGEKIYIVGEWEEDGERRDSRVVEYPYEISPSMYGDFFLAEDKKIYSFQCSHACYLLTATELFVFGNIADGVGLGAQCGSEQVCTSFTRASSGVYNILPGIGDTKVEGTKLIPFHDMEVMYKPEIFNVIIDEETYMFPPVLLRPESGMEDNVLTLVIRRENVFQEMGAEIKFVQPSDGEVIAPDMCHYPRIIDGEWHAWSEYSDEGRFYMFYKLEKNWTDIRKPQEDGGCHWEYDPDSNPDYDIYSHRIHVVEKFFTGMMNGDRTTREETFIFDLKVQFPKKVLKTSITIEQDAFSEYWEAYILDKTFDRDDRVGYIKFATVTRKPNYFILPNKVVDQSEERFANIDFSNLEALEDPHPNQPSYFLLFEDVFYISETWPVTESITGFTCDESYCYQEYTVHFMMIDDNRVCNVPEHWFVVNWVSSCHGSYHDYDDPVNQHSDCVDPSHQVSFRIYIEIDNLCSGEFVEVIDVDFDLKVYLDWVYTEEVDVSSHTFHVDDWVYFVAVVDVTESEVTLEEVSLNRVRIYNSDIDEDLYDISEPSPYLSALGESVGFVVDDVDATDRIGFHFKLSNEMLQLQPSDTETFTLAAYIEMDYKGNDQNVVANTRRQGVRLGSVYNHNLAFKVNNPIPDSFSVFPYVILGVAVCVAVMTFVLIAAGTALCLTRRKKSIIQV